MCYNIKSLRAAQLTRARNRERFKKMREEEIENELEKAGIVDHHQVSGFTHPKLIVYSDPDCKPRVATWGLVPETFDKNDPTLFWKQFNTLNATIEKMYRHDAYAYKNYSTRNHCLVYVNGFYEHHTIGKEKYPFFISLKNSDPFALAGIWSEWVNPATNVKVLTFSIVTTRANPIMEKIHNVHPMSETPRQPVILNEEMADRWLTDGFNPDSAKKFAEPFPADLLQFQTVGKLSGKGIVSNSPTASDKIDYQELNDFLYELESVK